MILLNKQKIIDYIEQRHLSDGGYFFARVEPSSGLDTYQAVKTLKLLGVKTKNFKAVASFWKREFLEDNLDDLFAVFLAVQTYKELGLSVNIFKKYQSFLINQKKLSFLVLSLYTFIRVKKQPLYRQWILLTPRGKICKIYYILQF